MIQTTQKPLPEPTMIAAPPLTSVIEWDVGVVGRRDSHNFEVSISLGSKADAIAWRDWLLARSPSGASWTAELDGKGYP